MWIYQHRDWPNFTWDADGLASRLAAVRHRQEHLRDRVEGMGLPLRREFSLHNLTSEIVKSWAIEGETIDPNQVRSSLAHRLEVELAGLVPVNRNVESVVEAALDASQGYSEVLTKDRLFKWHIAMFHKGHDDIRRIARGAWRAIGSGPMQVVSGSIGREKVHFEAPGADKLEREMDSFLSWFENGDGIDPLLKAAIAHLWLLTIHPFEDGNGRITRFVSNMALARANGTSECHYSLSTQLNSERTAYYNQLEKQQRGTSDITGWLKWFVDCLGCAVVSAEETLSRLLNQARLRNWASEDSVNERQCLVINRMLEDDFVGHMNTSKYASLAKCSSDTARWDIQDLKIRGIFVSNCRNGRIAS